MNKFYNFHPKKELGSEIEWSKKSKLQIYRMKTRGKAENRLQNFIKDLAKNLKDNDFLKEYFRNRGQERLLEEKVFYS